MDWGHLLDFTLENTLLHGVLYTSLLVHLLYFGAYPLSLCLLTIGSYSLASPLTGTVLYEPLLPSLHYTM